RDDALACRDPLAQAVERRLAVQRDRALAEERVHFPAEVVEDEADALRQLRLRQARETDLPAGAEDVLERDRLDGGGPLGQEPAAGKLHRLNKVLPRAGSVPVLQEGGRR